MPRFTLAFLSAVIALLAAVKFTRSPNMPGQSSIGGQPWADGPCPMVHTPQFETKKEDIWTKGATHMALLHNAILRGFNTVYLQAPHVKPEDYSSFIGYSLAWYRLVKSHHDDEEDELFPQVNSILTEESLWVETQKEHESFLEGLTKFDTYLSTLPSPTDFSGQELVRIMETFRKPFTQHFHSEIHTIASFASLPSAPATGSEADILAAQTFKAWGKKTLTKAGLTDVVPFALLNLDRTFEEGMWANWPPMPRPIRALMVYGFGSWWWSWWKFAACDAQGNPRPLYALQGLEETGEK